MSPSALLLENKRLNTQLAERDAAIMDRDAKIEQLARDLKTLEAHIRRILSSRGGGHLIPEGQGVLFSGTPAAPEPVPEHANEAPDGEDDGDQKKKRRRPKSAAKKVDSSALSHVERVHELPEDQRFCPETGLPLVPVGVKTFEEIEFQRSKLIIVDHKQIIYGLAPKQAEDRQAKPVPAPMPPRPLEDCAASATLLAWILTQKYVHHMPLYRQEQMFAREGLRLPRQTMCDWVLGCAHALQPIVDFLMCKIRAGPIMQLDDTPVMCQRGKGRTHFQAYLWTFVNPEVDGVVYRFTAGRASDLIAGELDGFQGFLLGDGYSGNQAATRKVEGEIVMAGCFAHTIRKFKEARCEVPGTAELFVDDIKALYAIEDEASELKLDAAGRLALRRAKSRPLLAGLLNRARRLRERYSDAGKMAGAIGYLVNQRKPLRRFLEDGRLPLDNNRCERSIRPIAIGRRNWLFAGSVRGGEAAATIYTLVESCRLEGIDMVDYLADVLVRVATHPASRIEELLPARWSKAATTDEARGQLAAAAG